MRWVRPLCQAARPDERLIMARSSASDMGSIHGALLASGYKPGSPAAIAEFAKMFTIMAERSHGIRRAGSAALDLAYVACGRLDGYYEKNLKPWDIAAGALLVTEAGGIAAEFNGETNYMNSGNIIAASPKVFGQMIGLLAEFA